MDELMDKLVLTFEEKKILQNILKNKGKKKQIHASMHGKYIVCNETGEEFKNRRAVAKRYSVTESTVHHYFKGMQKTLKGLTFKEVKVTEE